MLVAISSSLDERLRLLLQVCDAAAHAHQNGLIHRDLKPSNILVDASTESLVVKVIDFGLAKDFSGNADTITKTSSVVGSPIWMSPEQARSFHSSDSTIDTRTDIYSIGIVLYELLTDETPLSRDFVRSSPPAVVFEAICEVLPEYPSKKLQLDPSGRSFVDGIGNENYRSWVSRLRDELDWITLKAIEKDPGDRYATVNELSDDIKRFLADQPIAARPRSTFYSIRKFIKKQRSSFLLAGLGLAFLVAIGIVVATLNNEKDWQKELADSLIESHIANIEAFNYDDDSEIGNHREKLEALKVQVEKFEHAIARLEAEGAGLEAFQAAVKCRLASAKSLYSAGANELAIQQLFSLHEGVGERLPRTDEGMMESRLLLGQWLSERMENRLAKPILEESARLARQVFGPKSPEALKADILTTEASLHQMSPEEHVEACKALLERSEEVDDADECSLLANRLIAHVYDNTKEYEKSQTHFERAAEISARLNGEADFRTVEFKIEAAFMEAMLQQESMTKISDIKKLVETVPEQLFPEHRLCFEIKLKLATFLEERGKWPEALELVERTFESCEKTFGQANELSLRIRQRLIRTVCRIRDFQRLKSFCKESLPVYQKYSGEDSMLFTGQCEYFLAQAYVATQDDQKAIEICDRLIAKIKSLSSNEQYIAPADIDRLYDIKIRALVHLKRYDDAIRVSKQIEIIGEDTTKRLLRKAERDRTLSWVYTNKGDFAQSNACLIRMKECFLKARGESHYDYAQSLLLLQLNEALQGNKKAACEYGKEAVEVMGKPNFSESAKVIFWHPTVAQMVEALIDIGEVEEARKYSKRYLKDYRFDENAPAEAHRVRVVMAQILAGENKMLECEKMLLMAMDDLVQYRQHPKFDPRQIEHFEKKIPSLLVNVAKYRGDHLKAMEYESITLKKMLQEINSVVDASDTSVQTKE